MDENATAGKAERLDRKPYSKPELTKYGGMQDMTRTIAAGPIQGDYLPQFGYTDELTS